MTPKLRSQQTARIRSRYLSRCDRHNSSDGGGVRYGNCVETESYSAVSRHTEARRTLHVHVLEKVADVSEDLGGVVFQRYGTEEPLSIEFQRIPLRI